MQLTQYTSSEYADAQRALLPPGAAWDWPQPTAQSWIEPPHSAFAVGSAAGDLAWRNDFAGVQTQGGIGYALLQGIGSELARVGAAAQPVLDDAIDQHRQMVVSWRLEDYRRVAADAIYGVTETLPRKPFMAGSKVGQRLWSTAATFPVELLQVDHLIRPFRVGSKVGDATWSGRSRYMLRVRYYRSVVDPKPLWDALNAFKQAHVYLWFEDITGSGGSYAPD